MKKRKFMSILLTLVMLAAFMPSNVAFADLPGVEVWSAGGSGTEKDPYLIDTPANFAQFAYCAAENGKVFSGVHIKLTRDINLVNTCGTNIGGKEVSWTPIGNVGLTEQFQGIFDGNGHEIKNLYINGSGEDGPLGLFGYLGTNGVIKNLTVSGNVTSTESNYGIGGIVGRSKGVIMNCHNKVTVTGTSDVGGVLCRNDGGKVIECINSATVTGTGRGVGGIAGSDCGQFSVGKIERCYNTGNITGASSVGGIVGNSGSQYEACGTVKNCFNTGNISGYTSVGGVVGGFNTSSSTRGVMKNCYNTGNVSGNQWVAGVLGGGIANSTLTNCYYLEGTANCGADNRELPGQAEKLTAEQFKEQSSFKDWNFSLIWKMGEDKPLLRNGEALPDFEVKSVAAADGKACATVMIPKAGTYTVIFADYENGGFNKAEFVTLTVSEDDIGERTATTVGDISLGKGDKVMLWNSLDSIVPLCGNYIVQ